MGERPIRASHRIHCATFSPGRRRPSASVGQWRLESRPRPTIRPPAEQWEDGLTDRRGRRQPSLGHRRCCAAAHPPAASQVRTGCWKPSSLSSKPQHEITWEGEHPVRRCATRRRLWCHCHIRRAGGGKSGETRAISEGRRRGGGRREEGRKRGITDANAALPRLPNIPVGRPVVRLSSFSPSFSTAGRSLAASLHPIPVSPPQSVRERREINLEMELIK